MNQSSVREQLEHYFQKFHRPEFILSDPISIPHRFSNKQDIEIAGFWTAMLSWGQRKTILNKTGELMDLLDHSPHDFVINHKPKERKRFEHFVHRTFQYTDSLYFLEFLQHYYRANDSLEDAFLGDDDQLNLALFHERFFDLPDVPKRTRKHVATPVRKSRCKRLNMYLRWMVRSSEGGVDFGLWKRIKSKDLYIPLDVHVDNVARHFNLIKRKQTDWLTVLELTERLRSFDPDDPVKYDFALFGLGVGL